MSEFEDRLAASMERHENVLNRLADAGPVEWDQPDHKRLTPQPRGGKVDMCSCGEIADNCNSLSIIERRS